VESIVRAEPTDGNIRNARIADASEISRLIGEASSTPGTRNAIDLYDRGHLLVLDLGARELGGVVHVDVSDDRRAILDLLVVDPAVSGSHFEQRMSGVAHALCEAYGCDHLDTLAERRHVATRGRR
jgi:N-acetylglutamate synthase-like GNAT family acetyltransferase